jgi:hypothetical protein
MSGSRTIVGVLVLLLTVVSADAFQETAPVSSEPTTSGTSSTGNESAIGLAEEEEAGDGSIGPSSVGVPNLNFGLELLYGGKTSPDTTTNDDDVGLKGRLKHTF